jgi:hypothetical protein
MTKSLGIESLDRARVQRVRIGDHAPILVAAATGGQRGRTVSTAYRASKTGVIGFHQSATGNP